MGQVLLIIITIIVALYLWVLTFNIVARVLYATWVILTSPCQVFMHALNAIRGKDVDIKNNPWF